MCTNKYYIIFVFILVFPADIRDIKIFFTYLPHEGDALQCSVIESIIQYGPHRSEVRRLLSFTRKIVY